MADLDSEIRAAMTADVTTVGPERSVREAADVLRREAIGSVVVEGDPPGIVTKTDLVEGIRERIDIEETPVAEVMTTRPLTVDAAEPIREAVELMNAHGVKRLPVTEDGTIVGIITTTDLVECLAGEAGGEAVTVVGVFAEMFGSDGSSIYECVECGARVSASDHPGTCPECGGRMVNISVTQE
ncbi:MAG: rubrerythrin-like domain-containing protein [Haloquadratum sp.]